MLYKRHFQGSVLSCPVEALGVICALALFSEQRLWLWSQCSSLLPDTSYLLICLERRQIGQAWMWLSTGRPKGVKLRHQVNAQRFLLLAWLLAVFQIVGDSVLRICW